MAITPTDADIEKWYVMTAYKFELKAEKSLREAGFVTYLPKETSYIKKPRRRPVAVERPAISSLIFVHASWNRIIDYKRRIDDRLKFKMTQLPSLSTQTERTYLTVPDAQMATFISIWATRATLQASLSPILAPQPQVSLPQNVTTSNDSRSTLPIGTSVEITTGPLAGIKATTQTAITSRSRTTRISLPLASLLTITLTLPTTSLSPTELT